MFVVGGQQRPGHCGAPAVHLCAVCWAAASATAPVLIMNLNPDQYCHLGRANTTFTPDTGYLESAWTGMSWDADLGFLRYIGTICCLHLEHLHRQHLVPG